MQNSNHIKDLFNILEKHTSHGIEGYHVDNKYLDPRKIRQQKHFLEESTKKGSVHVSSTASAKSVKHKTSYLDEVQKAAARLPAPGAYNLQAEDIGQRSKMYNRSVHSVSHRATVFDEQQKLDKKNNYPSAATYDLVKKSNRPPKSDMSKAVNATFLESAMTNSIQVPGTGAYNVHDHRMMWNVNEVKWTNKPAAASKKVAQKLPPVGTYEPRPVSYSLFESLGKDPKGKKKATYGFGHIDRFKDPKPIGKDAAYNIASEWGLKEKMKKKDILEKISRPAIRSVYY